MTRQKIASFLKVTDVTLSVSESQKHLLTTLTPWPFCSPIETWTTYLENQHRKNALLVSLKLEIFYLLSYLSTHFLAQILGVIRVVGLYFFQSFL